MEYDDLIGVPFADGGRTKDGLDCWGLAMILLGRQGYRVPDYPIQATAVQEIADALKDGSHTARLAYVLIGSVDGGPELSATIGLGDWNHDTGYYHQKSF